MVENIVQALARITVMEHMVQIKRLYGLRPALQAHDELVYTVPINCAEDLMEKVLGVMKIPPSFARELPIDAEAAYGETYGDAK